MFNDGSIFNGRDVPIVFKHAYHDGGGGVWFVLDHKRCRCMLEAQDLVDTIIDKINSIVE